MPENGKNQTNITRREAFRRLGLAVGAAYVVPNVILVSEARAASSGATNPSPPSNPTPPSPPTAPSNVDELEKDEIDTDACKAPANRNANRGPTISAQDFERAQAAVEAGYAKPLDAIWADFNAAYDGQVIAIEFTGFRWRPRFRFKAISASGRLETIIVSARTGKIEKIIGC